MFTFNRTGTSLSKRCIAVFLAATVCLGCMLLADTALSGGTPSVSAEESVEDLRSEKEQLEAQQKELQAKRDQAAASLQEQEAQKALILEQISVKEQEIAVNTKLISQLDEQISEKNYEIAQKEQAIGKKETEIADRFEELRRRLRAISKSGSLASGLQLLMNSDGYSDYLIQNKAMERVSEQDQELMNSLEAELQTIQADKKELEKAKAALDEQRAPIVTLQNELNVKKSELDSLYSEVNAITEQLNADINNYNQSIAAAEEAAARLQDKIDEIIRTTVGTGQAFLSGTMYWPAPTCTYISSTFKYRWGRWHRGIDITGGSCYGDPIIAAADGVVVTAEYDSSYGYYVVLDHGTDSAGQRVMTLYAHCSQLLVGVGQTVSATDTIALIGSTGESTGAHLHFEVRLDGVAVDPIGNGYISTNGIIVDESL
ncbi:MAG: murein hydrolase activator EnvC family protein [Acutalibacteraceae bacterium]